MWSNIRWWYQIKFGKTPIYILHHHLTFSLLFCQFFILSIFIFHIYFMLFFSSPFYLCLRIFCLVLFNRVNALQCLMGGKLVRDCVIFTVLENYNSSFLSSILASVTTKLNEKLFHLAWIAYSAALTKKNTWRDSSSSTSVQPNLGGAQPGQAEAPQGAHKHYFWRRWSRHPGPSVTTNPLPQG